MPEYGLRRRMLSRSFHYQLKQSERTTLLGPPENTREHIVAASRAMLGGDWRRALTLVINDKMNAKVFTMHLPLSLVLVTIQVWNLFRRAEKVRALVQRHVKEACLRSYLLSNATSYATVSLEFLADMFELDMSAVHALVRCALTYQNHFSIDFSRMTIEDELSASIDEPTKCICMHRAQPTKLQMSALQVFINFLPFIINHFTVGRQVKRRRQLTRASARSTCASEFHTWY